MKSKKPTYIIDICLECGDEYLVEYNGTDTSCPFCPDCRKFACATCGIYIPPPNNKKCPYE